MFNPENYEDAYQKMYHLGTIYNNQDTKFDSQRVSMMSIPGSIISCSGKHLQDENNQMLPRLGGSTTQYVDFQSQIDFIFSKVP